MYSTSECCGYISLRCDVRPADVELALGLYEIATAQTHDSHRTTIKIEEQIEEKKKCW